MALEIVYLCNGKPFENGECPGTACIFNNNIPEDDRMCNHTLNINHAKTINDDTDSVFELHLSNDRNILYEELKSVVEQKDPILYVEKDVVFKTQMILTDENIKKDDNVMTDTNERNHEIFVLRESGMSYANIGIKFGLSRERVRQIVKKEKARATFRENPLSTESFTDCIYLASEQMDKGVESPLATRTHRALARTGILRAIDTIEGLTLDEYDDDTLLSIRNFGVASLDLARKANDIYKNGLQEKLTETKDI